MGPHIHAYAWTGVKPDFDRERARRPENPEFAASETPPLQVAHWLRKPRRLVRATFGEPKEAADWLGERVAESVGPSAPEPPLETRVALAASTLEWGGDVSWGFYLTGTRFLSLALVSCPNRADTATGCPLR